MKSLWIWGGATLLAGCTAGCINFTPEPAPAATGDDCRVEVINQAGVDLRIVTRGRQSVPRGTLPAMGTLTFTEDCSVGRVQVTASAAGMLPGENDLTGSQNAYVYQTQSQTAELRPREVTRLVFRNRRRRG